MEVNDEHVRITQVFYDYGHNIEFWVGKITIMLCPMAAWVYMPWSPAWAG